MEQQRKQRPLALKLLLAALWLVLAGLVCYMALIGLVYYWEVSMPQATDYDGIIVLGAQVLPDGEPSVQLRWRLDKAKECYAENPCYIVVSGAQGGKEPAPEGDVMRALLVAEGLPEAHVISDPLSQNTRENILNGWAILQEKGCTKPLIVTSDYHLPRALAIARDVGVDAQGAGSLCRPEWNFWLKNHMREALAWVKYWGVKYLGLDL